MMELALLLLFAAACISRKHMTQMSANHLRNASMTISPSQAIVEALAIGQEWHGDVRIILFVRLRPGAALDEALRKRIRDTIRARFVAKGPGVERAIERFRIKPR